MDRHEIVDRRASRRDIFSPNPGKCEKAEKTRLLTGQGKKGHHAATAFIR
jgi:hypothetical protein